jgi:NAD(P)-dependent dehydrogenase (short-subunit alcohol dehydrogenase family)
MRQPPAALREDRVADDGGREAVRAQPYSCNGTSGANRGIGLAVVEQLLARGARRVYATARTPATLSKATDLDPTRVVPLQLDFTARHQVAAAAARATDVTLLINNAGVLSFDSVLRLAPELVAQNMDTNYYGTLQMVRAFVPVLEANGGAIVNVLTLVALASMPGLGAYNASKAAAWSLTQSIRADLGAKGIAVYGVFPGAVDTDMLRDVAMSKTSPQVVARAMLDGVEAGTEDIFPDPMSQQVYAAWWQDHKAVERQFAAM